MGRYRKKGERSERSLQFSVRRHPSSTDFWQDIERVALQDIAIEEAIHVQQHAEKIRHGVNRVFLQQQLAF